MVDNSVEKGRERDAQIRLQEVALAKQLISERSHPLDLVREFISNMAAREVGAKEISLTYFKHPEFGHVFEFRDDGCGMDYTDDLSRPGRLDRFLSLGFSAVAGLVSDEFGWKGLGSKLAFQSRKIHIETWSGSGPLLKVDVNEPWETINKLLMPRPQLSEFNPTAQKRGTTITVYGHPPFQTSQDEEFYSFEYIKNYILHRTFVGFTRGREAAPKVFLNVSGTKEELKVGFPVLRYLEQGEPPEGTVFIRGVQRSKNLPGTNRSVSLTFKGLYTLDRNEFGLDANAMNTGLLLSIKGIPYFDLELRDFTRGGLATVPGPGNCSIICECDSIHDSMNIARSGYNDSEATRLFETILKDTLEEFGKSPEYRAFFEVSLARKRVYSADELGQRKARLQSRTQEYVYVEVPNQGGRFVHRRPENEQDTLAVLWKLEMLGALPFARFVTLEHGSSGPDLVAHFQETAQNEPEHFITVEAEYLFTNYEAHGHYPGQSPVVICWDLGRRPKVPIEPTSKPYKFTGKAGETLLRIFCLSKLENIRIRPGAAP